MTPKLARWSWILALPLSTALAAPAERAVELPLNSTGGSTTKSITVTKSGSTTTHKAEPVNDRRLSMRDVAPAGPDDKGVYHSVHDWVPHTPAKTAQMQAEAEESNHAHRAHWWSRPHQVASGQKAEEVKP